MQFLFIVIAFSLDNLSGLALLNKFCICCNRPLILEFFDTFVLFPMTILGFDTSCKPLQRDHLIDLALIATINEIFGC